MYSLADSEAFTLVSVPSTGKRNASVTMNVSPIILPCIRPMTSMEPPERACMTIFRRATADMRMFLKWWGSFFHGSSFKMDFCSSAS